MTVVNRRKFHGHCRGGARNDFADGIDRARAAGNGNGKIKVGQIGVGHAHASKLSVYRASADYEVVGIVEPDAAVAAAS